MTPLQLLSAGLSHTPNAHRPSAKKLTKDQQIAALKDELHTAQELMSQAQVNPLADPHLSRHTDGLSFSRAVPMETPHTVTRNKHHRMRVATLTLQPTLMRIMPQWVQNARHEEQPV